MKKLIWIFIFLFTVPFNAQKLNYSSYQKEIAKFQKKLNTEFKDKKTSPLPEEVLDTFESLEFFQVDTIYRVVATLKKVENAKPFKMQTTTDRLPLYKVFAIATFNLKGKTYNVEIYQDEQLTLNPEYKNYLFFPFTDLTNGKTTYAGGRYIDLEIPEGNELIIDFNKAYNPYCAYNSKYSCPIPPQKNHLNTEIKAGVKAFKKEWLYLR